MAELDDWELTVSRAIMRLIQEVQFLNPNLDLKDVDLTPIIEMVIESDNPPKGAP